MQVGATAQEKSTVLSFRMKIQGLALIGYTWQLSCCRHCFESEDFLQGENLRSMIRRRQRLCIIPFLEVSFLEKMDFWCYLGGVSTAVLRNRSLCQDFSFL
jgi:hypothetical protein